MERDSVSFKRLATGNLAMIQQVYGQHKLDSWMFSFSLGGGGRMVRGCHKSGVRAYLGGLRSEYDQGTLREVHK